MGVSQDLYNKAKRLIPGGTQLLSKRPEMFLPELWPAYYEKAKGCEIWDLDGNKYIDMSYMGIGACTLGYADKEIDDAVKKAIDKGSMTTLNAPEEYKLAELLIKLHPWANMVRFSRTGGEAMSIAVRIARAKTQKDIVLFCWYHGWHDWYLAANLSDEKSLDGHLLPGLDPNGVPRWLKGSSYPFQYNDTEAFLNLIKEHGKNVGVVVIESVRNVAPLKEFIGTIRQKTQELQIPLIFDEITAGLRMNIGGAHLLFEVNPDIAVFAKGMSNGYPMAAIVGTASVMEAAQKSFISSTYWTDRIGPVAAIATIKKMIRKKVPTHLIKTGRVVKKGWLDLAKKHQVLIHVSGIDPLGHFDFDYPNALTLKTLFTQMMLEKGFLATTAFYASLAHKKHNIQAYLHATGLVFAKLAKIIKEGNPEKYLNGPICHSGFKRLT